MSYDKEKVVNNSLLKQSSTIDAAIMTIVFFYIKMAGLRVKTNFNMFSRKENNKKIIGQDLMEKKVLK